MARAVLRGGVARERPADGVPAARALPLRIEGAHDLLGVERVAEPARELRLDVLLVLGALRKAEAELAVEGDRACHVADHDPEEVELRGHDGASVVCALRKPSSPAIGCSAATTLRM